MGHASLGHFLFIDRSLSPLGKARTHYGARLFWSFLSSDRSETLLRCSNSGGVAVVVAGVKLLLISHFY